MKILVDADACPVKESIIKIASEYSIPVIMIIDTSHILNSNYAEIIVVDKARDSVDIALINKTGKGDIVITQDYGVAAMALSKQAYAINQNGLVYNSENMDRLLFERHIGQKVRRAGGRTSSIKKRTKEDDDNFEKGFRKLIKEIILSHSTP